MNNEAFWNWWNQEWSECASRPSTTMEIARNAFEAGQESIDAVEIIATWKKIRQEINTPECNHMDELLGVDPKDNPRFAVRHLKKIC